MALFQKTKDSTDGAPSLPRPQVPMAAPGEAAAECMRVGKLLVDSEQLSAENLATALSSARGATPVSVGSGAPPSSTGARNCSRSFSYSS